MAVRQGLRLSKTMTEADQFAATLAYATWPDKGMIVRGRRLTILTMRECVRPNETTQIIHVAEAIDPSAVLYTMGPKAVLGEQVDGKLVTAPEVEDGDALLPPGLYDGPVVPGPAVDYGYEMSTYRFETPGVHRIVWHLGDLVSNELLIFVE